MSDDDHHHDTPASAPSPEETLRWQRRIASQANNAAWRIADQPLRTPAENQTMLHAAHASAWLWKQIGTPNQIAHADQLLAHVYALLALPVPARHHLNLSQPAFLGARATPPPWEVACAHIVAAGVAAAEGDAAAHRHHHAEAERTLAALADPQERAILEPALRVVPRPAP